MKNYDGDGQRVRNLYKRYLSKHGARDIWARELLNGWFEINDCTGSGLPTSDCPHDLFLEHYRLFEEINNG